MKKKIEALFKYLAALKTKSANVSLQCDDGGLDYFNPYINTDNRNEIKLPSNFESYIIDLYELYEDEIYSESFDYVGEHSSFYEVNIEFNVPKKRIYIKSDITVYGTEPNDSYHEVDEMDDEKKEVVYRYLDDNDTDSITIDYSGGGDSGQLEYAYNNKTGNSIDLDGEIEDICYDLLGDFPGWEINEGSSGNIHIDRKKISIDHNWNTEELIESDLELIIDISDLPE